MDSHHYISKCHAELQSAVAALGGDASSPRLQSMAELIIQSMTGPWRSFHTPEHIFEVGAGGTPVEVVAALFHDLVYAQVDSGIHVNLARYVSAYVRESDKGLAIDPMEDAPAEDLELVMTLFGFARGQVLSPFAGLNEFLSALLAVRVLEGILSKPVCAQIAACIEATVPFRNPQPDGKSCSQVLLERLKLANQNHALGLDDAACRETVLMGVRVANRDIGNFASDHPSAFLNNTWNLIPETNHDLVSTNTYTVKGYRISLQKMEGFLGFLQPAAVFRQFEQEPSDQEHQRRLDLTLRNLEVARLYLRLKLLSIALIESLSLSLGEEVSLSSIMGKLPGKMDFPIQFENYLPLIANPYQAQNDHEVIVMDLLETGRSADSVHDARHSPVASYLVKAMGIQASMQLLEQARSFFAGKITGDDLLNHAPAEVVQGLRGAMVEVFERRADLYRAI
jgi:hypothetical protein